MNRAWEREGRPTGTKASAAVPHVLVVDDESGIRAFVCAALGDAGYRTSAAADAITALSLIETEAPDVVLADLVMPKMRGQQFVEEVLSRSPSTQVIVLTGHGSVEDAVDLMKKGVYSVLTKPTDARELQLMVEKAIRDQRVRAHSRDLERRLEISERLAMIGKLAAGVAHELNSPLDGVIRFVKLTMESLPEEAEGLEYQREALSGLQRMSAIVKDLLTFSRTIAIEVEEEGIERLVKDAAKQVLAAAPDKKVEIRYDFSVPSAALPRGMFQVFRNLIENARDAVDPGGTIAIRTGVREGSVFVEVKDDGPGIPKKIRSRVFEPFFTTKKGGRGTGLGLSIVARLVERFGGDVHIGSAGARGTLVTVTMPPRITKRTTTSESEEEPDAG